MKLLKSIIIGTSTVCVLSFSTYLGILYGIPALVNSKNFSTKLEKFIVQKTGLNTEIKGLNISISPLFVTSINCNNFSIKDNKKTATKINKLKTSIDLKTGAIKEIDVNSAFIDIKSLQQALSKIKKNPNSKPFDISKIPNVNIHKITLLLNQQSKHKLALQDLKIENTSNKIKTVKFKVLYKIPRINKDILIGQNGYLYIEKNELFANNFQLDYDNSLINLNGKIYGKDATHDLSLQARNIPVAQTMKTLLFYQKLNDKNKKFIENFKNYSGKIDFDIYVKNKDITGICNIKELRANSVLFNVPIYFKHAKFVMESNTLKSKAQGILGGEPVKHSLIITNLMSKKRIVNGKVEATLTPKLIDTYLPEAYSLKSTADAKVTYKIQNKIPEVEYFINLNKGSDIYYKDAFLGLEDKNRLLYAKTVKAPNGLTLKEYQYSLLENNKKTPIIFGDGFFEKINGKLTPKFITCQTNGYAPTSVTGSFGQYVVGGEFKGKLKYDFPTNKITGNFELVKTLFNDFFVRSANVIAEPDSINITAKGSYKHQRFDCILKAENRLDGNFIIHDMEFLMNKFIIHGKKNTNRLQTNHHKHIYEQFNNVSSKIRDIDVTVDKWEIKVAKLFIDDIRIDDLEFFGNLKNSIFNFTIPKFGFAQGELAAHGKYNFNNSSSDISFSAENINSNEAASQLFNIENQISGTARANLHVQTFNKFQELYATGNFEVNDGFLPQLGDTEFMLGRKNRKHKVKMYDLTNIDFSHAQKLSSDLKGSFNLHNYDLKDINITSQQSFMSLYINGEYNILSQQACLNIFGKYDMDAPKGIRILFVPLNWILKLALRPEDTRAVYQSQLDKIPPVQNKKNRLQFFRVHVDGNLNTEDLNVVLKRIK